MYSSALALAIDVVDWVAPCTTPLPFAVLTAVSSPRLAAVVFLLSCIWCLFRTNCCCLSDGVAASLFAFLSFPQDEEQIHLVRLESLAQLVSMHAKDGAPAATGPAAAAAEDEPFKVGDEMIHSFSANMKNAMRRCEWPHTARHTRRRVDFDLPFF